MLPYYKYVCGVLKTPVDNGLVQTMESANQTHIKELDAKIEDAVANLGETEHSDALIAKALYIAKIGDKVYLLLLLL